jgi:hypothetical protein
VQELAEIETDGFNTAKNNLLIEKNKELSNLSNSLEVSGKLRIFKNGTKNDNTRIKFLLIIQL